MAARSPLPPPPPPPLTQAQHDLVVDGMPLVEASIASVLVRYRDLTTREELLGPGYIALHEAALCYREALHPDFCQYAQHHVHGRILDAVRTEHFSLRARVEHAMDRAFARMLSHASLGVDLFSDADDVLSEAMRKGCADALSSALLAAAESPEQLVIEHEERAIALQALREAVPTLRPHEREVHALFYARGMTLDDAARELGIHPNTAQRRHVSGLQRLRAALEARGVMTPPPRLDPEEPPRR